MVVKEPLTALTANEVSYQPIESKEKDGIVMEEKQSNIPHRESELNELPHIPLGKYRHFKGKEYALLYIAYHSETLKPMAVYRQLYGEGAIWVRPLSMFLEEVRCEQGMVPRFTYIGK